MPTHYTQRPLAVPPSLIMLWTLLQLIKLYWKLKIQYSCIENKNTTQLSLDLHAVSSALQCIIGRWRHRNIHQTPLHFCPSWRWHRSLRQQMGWHQTRVLPKAADGTERWHALPHHSPLTSGQSHCALCQRKQLASSGPPSRRVPMLEQAERASEVTLASRSWARHTGI